MTKIQVPEGMLKAGMQSRLAQVGVAGPWSEGMCSQVLEAALQWLSENPIVPTDEQADELWHHPKVLHGNEHYAKAMVRDWQRMMFLAEPEVPEEIRDLLWQSTPQQMDILSVTRRHDEDVSEAFSRGQRSKGDL